MTWRLFPFFFWLLFWAEGLPACVLAALHGQSLKSLAASSVDLVLGITLLSVESSIVLVRLLG